MKDHKGENRHKAERGIANLPIAKVVVGSSFHCNMTKFLDKCRKETHMVLRQKAASS